jgi:hypothetical protein
MLGKSLVGLTCALSITCLFPIGAQAAPRVNLKGKLSAGEGYQMALIDGAGAVSLSKISSNERFSFKARRLKGATIAVIDPDGRALGPVVLATKLSARKAYLGFSGKTKSNSNSINLGVLSLRSGYAAPSRKLSTLMVSKRGNLVASTDAEGNPEGAASGGLTVASASKLDRVRVRADGDGLSTPGSDSDADGIIDALDPDLDGDGIVNIADEDFAGNDNATFSSLVVDYANTLNANIGSVTREAIDAIIGGENLFSIGFWFSLPQETSITGGHVICADANAYCNRTTGSAVYGGLTESNDALRMQLWRNLNADGSGYPNLELLNVRGFFAAAAAIQPRAGVSAVRPGDTYLVNYTGNAGNVLATKLLVLSPFMVTVPALKSYTVNAVETTIDYSAISNQPGTNSNPISTDSSGLLTLNFWRPQRLLYRSETPSSETDLYREMGRLKYGVVVEGGNRQYTCAGLYTNLSGGITEVADPLGTDNSPFPDQGAELFPLRDSNDDATLDSTRTISVTIDLRSCLTRASQTLGTKQLRLVAQGEELSGGSNSASQLFYVNVQ